jgi:hypothetical protein
LLSAYGIVTLFPPHRSNAFKVGNDVSILLCLPTFAFGVSQLFGVAFDWYDMLASLFVVFVLVVAFRANTKIEEPSNNKKPIKRPQYQQQQYHQVHHHHHHHQQQQQQQQQPPQLQY